MQSAILLLLSAVFFIAAYFIYGGWIARKLKINDANKTPAHTERDGIDYMPAPRFVLLGHHFASIAGVGPIVGPIVASQFGWLPVFLWILLGSVFIGAVHDFTSLVASMRHKGKTIGAVMEHYLGPLAKKVFLVFTWFTLVLVIAVFAIVISNTLVATPQAGTSSGLFIVIAVAFGYFVYVKKTPLLPSTVLGVALLLGSVWLGIVYPLSLQYNTWIIILLIYVVIASVTPVWLLLQPRDYLNSFFLYIILAAGFLGVLFYRPTVEIAAFTGFHVEGLGWLFPILFVTVACGAVSGFHSIVASGSSSKQIEKESDSRFVGFGGMLIEGVLAVIALITAIMLTKTQYAAIGSPGAVFASGFGTLVSALGIPASSGKTFASLAISAFALTTLDTATRLGRYTLQELFDGKKGVFSDFVSNRFTATFLTVAAASFLAFNKGGTMSIWPLFGSANQMLASLALLTVSAWLAKNAVNSLFARIPAVFMFLVTIAAIGTLIRQNIVAGNLPLTVISCCLMATALFVSVFAFMPGKEKTAA
ncbi:MAG TPA: carbon starvation protein A [Candidatus Goldiibacteriota bacterium]|nr:carbon starvation protein A [Candidatus Goldiibacteriota bacterium]